VYARQLVVLRCINREGPVFCLFLSVKLCQTMFRDVSFMRSSVWCVSFDAFQVIGSFSIFEKKDRATINEVSFPSWKKYRSVDLFLDKRGSCILFECFI